MKVALTSSVHSRASVVVALTVAISVTACSGCSSASGPPTDPGTGTPGFMTVTGLVQNTGNWLLSGADAAVVSGSGAGASSKTDADGKFVLTGRFDSTTQIRVSLDGYVSSTLSLLGQSPGVLSFTLASMTPPIDISGNYTLSLSADATCMGVPSEFRNRRYDVSIERIEDPRLPPGTAGVRFLSGEFLEGHDGFAIFVTGNDLQLLFEEHGGPYVVERVAPGVYVTFVGTGSTVGGVSADGQFSGAFRGTVNYCALISPTDSVISSGDYSFMCPQATASAACPSKNHRFTLTRR